MAYNVIENTDEKYVVQAPTLHLNIGMVGDEPGWCVALLCCCNVFTCCMAGGIYQCFRCCCFPKKPGSDPPANGKIYTFTIDKYPYVTVQPNPSSNETYQLKLAKNNPAVLEQGDGTYRIVLRVEGQNNVEPMTLFSDSSNFGQKSNIVDEINQLWKKWGGAGGGGGEMKNDSEDKLQKLERLNNLLKDGAITQKEFEQMKLELLDK